MEIIVCIKQVPAANNIEVDSETGVLKRDGFESKMNPYDLYALETAIRIKEEFGGNAISLTMGPPQAEEILNESIYMGIDSGYLLTDRKFAGADVVATSYTLSQGIRKIGQFDLIICGKQTTDGDTAQVGPEMAEFLKIPHVANVCEIIEINNDSITVKMNMEDTEEIQKIKFPCLITVEKNIYTPRLPSYKRKKEQVTSAEKKIKYFNMRDFEDQNRNNYGLMGSPTQVERIFPPESFNTKEIHKGTDSYLIEKAFSILKDGKFID